MINVAFCDDEVSALDEMREFLDRYCRERDRKLNHTAFRSPVELQAECRLDQESSLILRCKGVITRVELGRLEFCEVIHRTLLFHLNSGKVLESIGSMDELDRQLAPYGGFLRVHRSYIVNLDYVQNISHRTITMTCLAELPIPRGKYNEIKNAFLAHAFQTGQVSL